MVSISHMGLRRCRGVCVSGAGLWQKHHKCYQEPGMSAPPLTTPTFRSKHLRIFSCWANWKVLPWLSLHCWLLLWFEPQLAGRPAGGSLENPKHSSPAHRPPTPIPLHCLVASTRKCIYLIADCPLLQSNKAPYRTGLCGVCGNIPDPRGCQAKVDTLYIFITSINQ